MGIAVKIDVRKAIHLTDLEFARFCKETFGLNRGVYNTMDAWFYAQGVTRITDRRTYVLTFLEDVRHLRSKGNLTFGHGGLMPSLMQFWNKYHNRNVKEWER